MYYKLNLVITTIRVSTFKINTASKSRCPTYNTCASIYGNTTRSSAKCSS
uniref:Uncharacterized protein n=1 Tax=uncultured marine virus TaxID=186617 RepID=A0A0F7LBA5_9VIRU|nr:hypothetical protein [uncultured marine virus]